VAVPDSDSGASCDRHPVRSPGPGLPQEPRAAAHPKNRRGVAEAYVVAGYRRPSETPTPVE
jgi:hypothetical protein